MVVKCSIGGWREKSLKTTVFDGDNSSATIVAVEVAMFLQGVTTTGTESH